MIKSIQKVLSKIKYILFEEGFNILIKRFVSYILFSIKIFVADDRKLKKEWNDLRSSNENKRIFLLGNGPSLNKTPLYLLKYESIFCFNRFNLMLERLDYVPEYYACIDDRVLSTISKDIEELATKVKFIFLPYIHPSSNKNFYAVYKNLKNVYWLVLNKFSYSLDLPYAGINKSVTNCSLQIAAYLGFKEIYLLGVDMDYEDHQSVVKENTRDWTSKEDDDPNHFDPRYFGKGTQYHHPRLDETFKKWEEAKVFFEKREVKIYNATVGGKLEVFERVNLHDLFQFSEKEEMLLFLNKFNISEFKSSNLIDYFENAFQFQKIEDWNNENKFVITNVDDALKLIPKVIFDYTPHGPIFGQYLFVKREK